MGDVETLSKNEPFERSLLRALRSADALSEESAERAARAHKRAGGGLVDILVRLGLCEEKALARAVAEVTGLRLLDAADFPDTAILRARLSAPFLREARAVPVAESDAGVLLAAVDPTDALTARAFGLVFDKPLSFAVSTAGEIDDAILRLYAAAEPGEGDAVSATAADITDLDVARLRQSAGEAPIIRFVERLIARAIDAGASDIHIEPLERQLRVRMRVDGMLADEDPAPLSSSAAIVSRVKILARLDIAERRLPQDGRIKLAVRGLSLIHI